MLSNGASRVVEHEIYPKRYFDESPTWFAWNKLTANGVQRLRQEPGFEGQRIYFYLNHPIQFVSLTGLASQIELGGGAAASKFCFITVDDGSGDVINVKITRRHREEGREMGHPSNTTVDELNVDVKLGLPALFVNKKQLSVGQCIRVRGTLDSFRGNRQIDLRRIKLVESTADEIDSWTEVAQWKRDVLDKPWILTDSDRERIDTELEAERKYLEERKMKKRAWHARQAERQSHADRKAALTAVKLEAAYNEGALPGSEIVKAPWE